MSIDPRNLNMYSYYGHCDHYVLIQGLNYYLTLVRVKDRFYL